MVHVIVYDECACAEINKEMDFESVEDRKRIITTKNNIMTAAT